MHSRRTLKELVARYELEPDLCDIYVEGSSDKAVLDDFFEAFDRTDVAVYAIDSVEVPSSRLEAERVSNNNRGRVIALARYLSRALDRTPRVTCVIDADFDHVLGISEPCSLVVTTDYTSMDMYYFESRILRKFLRFCVGDFLLDESELVAVVQPVLEKLFFIRLANFLLDLCLTELSFDRCCLFREKTIAFDVDDYVQRYLHRNRKADRLSEFWQVVAQHERDAAALDTRMKMHGHDFTELLAWLIKSVKPKTEIRTADAVARVLRACVDPRSLRSYGMFDALYSRCAP